MWIMLTGLSGCPMDRGNPPKIANLVYIPQQAPVDEGKSTAIIGTFDITREMGEIVSINTEAFDAQGKKISSGSFPMSDAALKTSDTLGFGFDMSTSVKGEYTFQIYIIDSRGQQSNRLVGTYAVTGIY
jgi:hypothetical protein